MTSNNLSIEIQLSPAFHDLDPMNIVWHGNYAKYLEIARCALLAKFNYDYPQMKASGYAWPIVDMRLKYIKPATFGQQLIVHAEITEWESRLKINYLIRDAVSGHKINQAHTIQVAVDIESGEMQYVCPAILWQRLGVEEPQ
ncbi:thioesterase family protein [Iodobacter sp.]|uniref:acyl-CoA thioesterase n=1 Tax=Iodobacter sp. TaxID=1915058 RepID=UPI0025D3EEC7|nr:acyl-CoA thioesterase [Iodobacter sp.]